MMKQRMLTMCRIRITRWMYRNCRLSPNTLNHKVVELDRREGKGRRCYWGEVFEWRNNYLAARMIWKKVFERTSTLGGRWFGVVWTERSSIFPKQPFYPFFFSTISSNHPGAKPVVRFRIESILSPNSNDDLCLLFCLLLLQSLTPWHFLYEQSA